MPTTTESLRSSPRERLLELLVTAPPPEVAPLAARAAELARVEVRRGPEIGLIAMQVREPVAGERFLLADVLATVVEVEVDGTRGWAMRLGEDRVATLACAICDAVLSMPAPAGGLDALARDIVDLCARSADRAAGEEAAERRLLAPTAVAFEELD